MPIDKKEMGNDGRRSARRSLHQSDLEDVAASQMHPALDVLYEVTHRDKMSYMAITMMKVILKRVRYFIIGIIEIVL